MGVKRTLNKNGEAQEIIPEAVYQSCLSLNSLDALVQMVKTEGTCADRPDKLYLSVKDHMTVTCFGQPQHDLRDERITYYEAQAKDVPGWDGEVKMPFDRAAVALQTRFQDGGDRDYALTLLSQITCGAKVTYNDTGIATTVVTNKGVSLQQNSTIRPLVKLRPYRSFAETEQVESEYLLRVDPNGKIGLFEADGGMWQLGAKRNIAVYIRDMLVSQLPESVLDDNIIILA